MGSDADTEDDDILRIAREVLEKLGITSFRPVRVSWTDFLWAYTYPDSDKLLEAGPFVRNEVPNGWVVFTWDQLALPVEMKGKLDPEEWRPLIASSLIYEAKLRRKRYFGAFLIFLPLLLDGVGWWQFTTVYTSATRIQVSFSFATVYGLFAGVAVLALLPKWFSKRLRLEADALAGEITGSDAFLHVLEKIRSAGLKDQQLKGPFGPAQFFNGRPSLEERIANLKKQEPYRKSGAAESS